MLVKSKYASLSATSGQDNYLALPITFRGTITRIVVKQTSGTLAGFTVDLYDCDPLAPPDGLDADVHKIIGTLTAAAAASTVADYDMIPAYENQEVDTDDASKRQKPRIYIKINPSGTGAKTFHIGYTTTTWMSS